MIALAAEQSGLALALVLSGSILMLLLGTQILSWYWLLLLAATGIGTALLRINRRRITPYRLAQLLDQRFMLSDSLSTAWFLSSEDNRRNDSVAQFQIAHAEELAANIHPGDAFPFQGKRTWALAAALAAAAFGLFAVRYMVTNSLNLRGSLVPIHLDSIFERSATPPEKSFQQSKVGSKESDAKLFSPLVREGAPRDSSLPVDTKGGAGDGLAGSSSPAENSKPQINKSGQEGQSGTTNSARSADAAKSTDQPPGESPGQNHNNEAGSPGKDASARAQESSSQGLMDKMKDALSSMMAKLRPSQSSGGSPQNSKQESSTGKNSDSKSASKDASGQQQNAGNEQTSRDQGSTGQGQGETKEQAQASTGQSSEEATESGSDAHSGVGKQDGDKALKDARQLEAMGKLEEIIGKRSANLTGEMSVETSSSKQDLRTSYSQRQGHHADLGGEINRDEIPLMYQQYVRDYMEQVRKQSGTAH